MSADRKIICPKSLTFSMGTSEELLMEIERRILLGSDWASGNARPVGIETTCNSLMALSHDQERSTSEKRADSLATQEERLFEICEPIPAKISDVPQEGKS